MPFRISKIAGRNLTSWRNFAPLGFFGGLGAAAVLGAAHPAGLALFALGLLAYAVVAVTSGITLGWKRKSISLALTMPFIFALWHACYALGSARGLAASTSRT